MLQCRVGFSGLLDSIHLNHDGDAGRMGMELNADSRLVRVVPDQGLAQHRMHVPEAA